MRELQYTVRFVTPAFLGNAEQNGQWRTPPFKAQLRQWWRVAYASANGFRVDVAQMRREEGLLFGNAWLEHNFRKSLVRLRLDRWDEGSLKKTSWPADITVTHPEVKNREGRLMPVGSALYQGYGPLTFDNQRRTTTLKANAAIQAGEEATLSLAFPEEFAALIEQAIGLMHRYGTMGGRSRNGWGSYILRSAGEAPPLSGKMPMRSWRECLKLDWPHAIGVDDDGKPLIWKTKPFAHWREMMRQLAEIKIGLRTQFKFTTGSNARHTDDRHWLSYPVTKHSVAAWGNSRLPNTLRFKVRPSKDGKLIGVIFHMPCLPPASFDPDPKKLEAVWQKVHTYLNGLSLTRSPQVRE